MQFDFDLQIAQKDFGVLHVEFLDDKGNVASRIVVDSTATIKVKGGARYGTMLKNYETNKTYRITAKLSVDAHMATFFIDGKKVCTRMFDTPVEAIIRVSLHAVVVQILPKQPFNLCIGIGDASKNLIVILRVFIIRYYRIGG